MCRGAGDAAEIEVAQPGGVGGAEDGADVVDAADVVKQGGEEARVGGGNGRFPSKRSPNGCGNGYGMAAAWARQPHCFGCQAGEAKTAARMAAFTKTKGLGFLVHK